MRRARMWCALLFGAVLVIRATAQVPAGISVAPRGMIPLGASSELFTFGGGAELAGSFALATLPLYLRGAAGYTVLPAQADASYLSLVTLGAGGGLSVNLGRAAADACRLPTSWRGPDLPAPVRHGPFLEFMEAYRPKLWHKLRFPTRRLFP